MSQSAAVTLSQVQGYQFAVTYANEQPSFGVMEIRVTLHLGVPADELQHLGRVLAQFEQFCTVTQSLRQAVPVQVEVRDAAGTKLK